MAAQPEKSIGFVKFGIENIEKHGFIVIGKAKLEKHKEKAEHLANNGGKAAAKKKSKDKEKERKAKDRGEQHGRSGN